MAFKRTLASSSTAQRRLSHVHRHLSTSQRHGIGHGDLNGQESQDRSLKDPSVSRLNDATEGLARSSAQEPSTAAPGSHDRGGKAAAKDQSTAVPTSNSKPPPSPESKATFYKYFLPFQTTWKDNDQYGHLNNAVYVKYFDGLINEYLVRVCGLEPLSSTEPIGLIIASNFKYALSLEFPRPILAGLAVTKLGKSSVTYAVALFSAENTQRTSSLPQTPQNGQRDATLASFNFSYRLTTEDAACYGVMTHVFVDPKTRRPVPIPSRVKEGLNALLVNPSS